MPRNAILIALALVGPAERLGAARIDRLAPHPVITEVMFNVPKGDDGDANRDGARHSTGDEFVEIVNPHRAPINLAGYTITNRLTTGDPSTKRGVRFRFPSLELPPGGVVVLFNGCEARIGGPVGSPDAAPAKASKGFGNAAVFSMENPSKNRAFANGGDFVLLSAPDGTPVDAIWWGSCDPMPPSASLRIEEADRSPKGSVHRGPKTDRLHPHVELNGQPSSPGTIP